MEDETLTPPELKRIAATVKLQAVPKKSKEIYLKHYLEFREYLKEHKTESISENTLLAYLQHLLETRSVSTCWTIYSCLKKMIRINDGLDISRWPMLTDVLKTKSATHQKKKAKVFTREEIDRFLKDAPNDQFLEDKLALLLGLHGGLRTEEFLKLAIEDIEKRQDYLKVTVRERKTDQAGNGSTFIAVKNEAQHQCPLYYFQQYLDDGRSQLSSNGRLFMQKRKGKFTNQPHGRAHFMNLPRRIATYLGLHNVDKYTGHAIRRTSTTWLAENGASTTLIQNFGGWKSSSVAQEYIDKSDAMKLEISKTLAKQDQGIHVQQTTATIPPSFLSILNSTVNVVINNWQKPDQ